MPSPASHASSIQSTAPRPVAAALTAYRRGAARVVVLAAVAVVAMVESAPAQAEEEEGSSIMRRMYVGAIAAPLFDAPPQFSEDLCSPERTTLSYGARLGFGFGPYFALEGGLSIHHEYADSCLLPADPAPPPQNGMRTVRVYQEGTRGYPFGSDEVRVIVRMHERPGRPSGRLLAGAGWLWSKDIGFLLAGGGLRYGGERLAGTLDVEQWWFDVPFIDVEEAYLGGQLVSQEQTPGEDSESPIVIRFGVNWRL